MLRSLALIGLGVIATTTPLLGASQPTPEERHPTSRSTPLGHGSKVDQVLNKEESEVAFRKEDRSRASPERKSKKHTLGDAERIRLRANGFRELDGEYIINSDATVSIAGVGRLSVQKLTPTAFEHILGEKLSSLARRTVSISTEVVRYKPYYITGHVEEPGSSEWRPGLTLIQALALSGGVARTPTTAERVAPERLLLQEQARTHLKFALAQLERLNAEKRSISETQPSLDARRPESETKKTADAARGVLKQFTVRQTEILNERIALTQSRIASLLRAKEMTASELRAATAQKAQMSKQLLLVRDLVRGLGKLRERGIVSKSQYLERQAQLSEAIVHYANIRSVIERVRSRQLQIDRQIDTIRQTRQAELNDSIERLEREVAQLRLTSRGTESHESSDTAQQPSTELKYYIARKYQAETRTIEGTLFTKLRPGDVIIVSASQRGLGEQTVSGLNAAQRPQTIVEQSVRTLALPARRRNAASRR